MGLLLIAQGDDFGSSISANRAIIDSCRKGILRNAGIMANGPAIADAAAYANEPGLCFGLHAVLNAEWDTVRWGPVSSPELVPSLIRQDDATFHHTPGELRAHSPRLEEIMLELASQLAYVRELGFSVAYADTHMRFDWIAEGFDEAFDSWCRSENLINYKRIFRPLPAVAEAAGAPPDRSIDHLLARLALTVAQSDQEEDRNACSCYTLIGHPVYDGEEIRACSNATTTGAQLAAQREEERQWFMDPRVIKFCEQHDIAAVSYSEALERMNTEESGI